MSEERKLQRAKINLMRSPKFALLSGILMVGKTKVVEKNDMPAPACTDGRDEKYRRDFIAELSDPELAFVVAHEGAHKMYRHLSTWQKLYDENAQLANMACDYVVNLMLTELDPAGTVILMPTYKKGPMRGRLMGLVDPRFKGMNTKQVYDILKEEQKKGNGGGDGGFDSHDWDNVKDMPEEEKKQLAKDIDDAIRRGVAEQKRVGKGNGHLDRELKDLLEPKVDWREVLREFIKSVCAGRDKSSWRKPNRRLLSLGTDTYMPSMISEKVGRIVLAVDTSGSIGADDLRDFLSEVKGIADEVNPEFVDLLYWGTQVVSHEEYDGGAVANITTSTKPMGGGGTAPSCITNYLKDKFIQPECVVVLTDGCVGDDWGGSWPAPVLWAIVGGNDAIAANGKTIHVKEH
jgi:predicted metal-dependent peptidase